MTTLAQRMRQAADFINRARGEETPDGSPLVAARNYITAMEIIATVGDEVPIDNVESRRFFLYQLRQRMEMYYERARLLLDVAEESGLIDKPAAEGGLQAALQLLGSGTASHSSPSLQSPPELFNNNNNNNGGGGGDLNMVGDNSKGMVMGIPLDSSATHEEPPVQYYFSQPPQIPTVVSPQVQGTDSIDALLDQFTFSDEKKK
ncbi:uncharacterized protein TM35_002161000 [Trypanosoma theileri]|uniref:Uncharacterized protein n=1 Tax=Trypanosoma theileri TaxID=67003 RepID=A0A1X0NDQ9_9TRYP|nr:uncharacterized protein TM35_002161000 [Trypanosoma theileri]ORC79265.1 hypothetical protein TM35_002161000 [Trypanosoma theileri]